MIRVLVFLAGTAAVFFGLASNAQAGSGAVFGINDDGFRTNCTAVQPYLEPFGNVQVGVWVTPDDNTSWCTPLDRGILLQLVGCNDYYVSHPEEFAAQALRLALQHRNIKEVQVCNEPELCVDFPCASVPVNHTRFYGVYRDRYFNLLKAVREKLAGTGVLVLGFGFSAPFRHWDPKDVARALKHWYLSHGNLRWHCRVKDIDAVCLTGVFTSRGSYDQPIMDLWAYHPYCGSGPKVTRRVWRALNRYMRNLPGGTPQLAMSESGVDTLESVGQFGYLAEGGPKSKLCGHASGTEAEQAEYISQIMRQARNNPKIGLIFNYGFFDESNINRMQTGILRPDGSKKPAYFAYLGALPSG